MEILAVSAPDLTQRPPRSPRARLGGYALLPRMLDKGRATIAGKAGEYHYACPLDQRILAFLGIDSDALLEQLAKGLGDGEILAWIKANQKNHHTEAGISAWSVLQGERAPSDVESREFFNGIHKEIAPHREDIATWADLLDLEDYVSFGGKA